MKITVLGPLCSVHSAHVIDHHWHSTQLQRCGQLVHQSAFEVNLKVHAHSSKAWRQLHYLIDRRAIRDVPHEIETHAPKACLAQALQFGIRDISFHQRHPQVAAFTCRDGVFDDTIVRTVHDGLNDDATLYAHALVQ